MSERRLQLNGKEIVLIGTAHVSEASIEEVKTVLENEKPDSVGIELDEGRYKSMMDPESWRNMDIVKVLRQKKGWVVLANLVLASAQKKMGAGTGVKPGEEMKAAIDKAAEMNVPAVMVDRPIQVTLRRAWAKNSFWGKCKLLASMIASAFDSEEISSDQIESLKDKSEMDTMMNELADYLPAVKQVLIDERDTYLAAHIWEAAKNLNTEKEGALPKFVAVLGAGHLDGVVAHLEKMAAGTESTDTTEIQDVPPKTKGAKIAGWAIPVLIVLLIVAGFVFGGQQKGWDMLNAWVLWNGCLAAIGSLLALAHPLVILISFVGAPITSLCPFVGIGLVAGILQGVLCKPKVSDMENLQTEAGSFKGWYKNRILRVLLVFLLSSLGSSIGTFVAGSSFVVAFISFFDKVAAWIKGLFA